MLAIPISLEYHRWVTAVAIDDDFVTEDKEKDKDKSKNTGRLKLETLLVGDDLGVITKYDFT